MKFLSRRRAARIDAWIATLPPTIRPAAVGVALLLGVILARGAVVIGPLAIVAVFATSHTPWSDLGRGAGVLGLAMLGAALSGFAYGLVGRRLQHAFSAGRYLTGIVTIAPYMAAIDGAARLINRTPFWSPLSLADAAVIVGMTLLYGPMIGQFWFRPPSGTRVRSSSGQPNDR
jgi:hypothetical protein